MLEEVLQMHIIIKGDEMFTNMYGPGRPFKALKHKQVSSMIKGPLI